MLDFHRLRLSDRAKLPKLRSVVPIGPLWCGWVLLSLSKVNTVMRLIIKQTFRKKKMRIDGLVRTVQ